ncbi:MAG: AAA family ATPase [Alphaproteobacteria bacterium]|nr:AAA family ATPase [Alphaproteobacteria bacterium]
MHLETVELKNFKSFRHVKMSNLPRFCVIVGANGSGKSTLFNVFAFLKEAMATNIDTALVKQGGAKRFEEVRSRQSEGNIEIKIQYRERKADSPLVTYLLEIGQVDSRPVVEREYLSFRRGTGGRPWHFLDFKRGAGEAVTNEVEKITDVKDLVREKQVLKSPDILAIKGLAQFKRFPAVVALGDLIENWHVSDFHINRARPDQSAGFAEHLSSEGDNLSLMIEYLYNRHRHIFDRILKKMAERVPGVSKVEAKTTEEGRVLLRFKDGAFEDPFLARYVSDGTIKMLAYLVLLYDPKPHQLLCVEEPENQLYPSLLQELAEEFRDYSRRGGQVFVSTHSPDFLNAVNLDEVFWLSKGKDGYTDIKRASDDPQLRAFVDAGDTMGSLWKQGFFEGADP